MCWLLESIPGIKVPPGHRGRESTNLSFTKDSKGKFHAKLTENNKKRVSDPINLDLEDGNHISQLQS